MRRLIVLSLVAAGLTVLAATQASGQETDPHEDVVGELILADAESSQPGHIKLQAVGGDSSPDGNFQAMAVTVTDGQPPARVDGISFSELPIVISSTTAGLFSIDETVPWRMGFELAVSGEFPYESSGGQQWVCLYVQPAFQTGFGDPFVYQYEQVACETVALEESDGGQARLVDRDGDMQFTHPDRPFSIEVGQDLCPAEYAENETGCISAASAPGVVRGTVTRDGVPLPFAFVCDSDPALYFEPGALVDEEIPCPIFGSDAGVSEFVTLVPSGETSLWVVDGSEITQFDFALPAATTIQMTFELNSTPEPAPIALCNGYEVTVDIAAGDLPTDGDDVILGTEGDDTINAGRGRDVICGLGGDDVIKAGKGPDIVFGGAGDDVIDGGKGADVLKAGAGDDTVSGGNGADTLVGFSGADDLRGNSGTDVLIGGSGDDSLRGGRKADSLSGGNGADALLGGKGADVLDGGAELDEYNGGGGQDTCTSDPNNLVELIQNCEL